MSDSNQIMVIFRSATFLLQHIAIILWLTFIVVGNADSQTSRSSNFSCPDSERWALLTFKTSLVIGSKRDLSNWSNENIDCCRWEGIRCSKAGHVVTLNLHGADNVECEEEGGECIGGEINSSLLHLPYLDYLDLSNNNFTKLPKFVGSLNKLRYLNLSNNPWTGIVPHQLGNLSILESLDLNSPGYFQVDSFAWVAKLTSLKFLDLSGVSFSQTSPLDWFSPITKLPHLKTLYLIGCQLIPCPTPKQINASTSLEVVDLSGNDLADLSLCLNASMSRVNTGIYSYPTGPIPDFLSKLESIKHLQLSDNHFEGAIPETFSKLGKLLTLDVSFNRLNDSSGFLKSGSNSLRKLHADNNNLQGNLPELSKFPSLQVLNLAQNVFRGSLSELLGQSPNLSMVDVCENRLNNSSEVLRSKSNSLRELRVDNNLLQGHLPNLSKFPFLEVLNLAQNELGGIVTDCHFRTLSKLQVLSLSTNSLTLNFSTSFIPPFQLRSLKLRDCKLGESFPLWLRTQKKLIVLDISNAGISDVVPTWFWSISSRLQFLNVSFNSVAGMIPPNSLESCYIAILSFNRFHGPVPIFPRELQILDLSSNTFSGGITFFCGLKADMLNYLDLSNNLLSGSLPNCWERFQNLGLLNLNNNNFTGFLPNSMGKLQHLNTLSLQNNSLSGPLPKSMKNCTSLILLDFGKNQFSGYVPKWIGKSLTDLGFLRLNSNKFEGKIPSSLCSLDKIQFLDFSFNNISGTISSCLNMFKSMAEELPYYAYTASFRITTLKSGDVIDTRIDDFTALVFWKGLQIEFKNMDNIQLLNLIDLSSNRLSGSIPGELTYLYGLASLNLSHNDLVGPIPDTIGQMTRLESLDLSHNQLSSEIPLSMSNISGIGYLDLSYNNLSGTIPTGTQLQTIDATMFRGNPGLCGAPLPNSCSRGVGNVFYDLPNTEGGDVNESLWMHIIIGLGFIVGFWGVCGALLVKESWRRKYFLILDHCKDSFLVALAIGLAKFRRRFAT